mmetsp:Transcript_12251/g.28761  ORF Transcript_12251/g.28761 Transcript_12251/m.28761 type:complete len:113 (+) Transcript_12251:454-792(+)
MPPKNYSGMQVAAPKRWAQLEAAELVRPTKGGKDGKPLGWPWTAKKAEGGQFLGCEGRWPDPVKRMRELKREVNKNGWVNVIDLIDHVIDESERGCTRARTIAKLSSSSTTA